MILAALALLIAAPSSAPPSREAVNAAQTRVQAVVSEAVSAGRFSGEVRVTWAPGADIVVRGSPPGPLRESLRRAQGRFRLASLTKQATAVLVMQAVEAGKLSLETTAGTLLPDTGAPVKRATVRQLLQHTSGIANPSDGVADDVVPPFYTRTDSHAGDHLAAATGACSGAAKAEPGAGFSYNNCDYIVLGALLERLYGEPVAQIVETRITRPLKLTWRIAPAAPPIVGAPAVGYGADGQPELFQNVATYGASGALIGTTADVAIWDAAILDHRLLNPETTALMFTPDPKLYGEALSTWAFDSDLGDGRKVRVWKRQGDIGGTRLLNLILPSQHLSIVIAANTEKADLFDTYSRKGLGYAVLQAVLERPLTLQASPDVARRDPALQLQAP